MDYFQWNDLLVKYFFNDNRAYEDTILYINEDILIELNQGNPSSLSDFVSAIKNGPFGAQNDEICESALNIYNNWRKVGKWTEPPYVTYLCFFVLVAATEDDEFASHAYYPKFWKLLGYPGKSDVPPGFYKMILLWEDLEKWSCEENHELLGKFVMRVRGKWRYVGIPLFQTLCSTEEIRNLPRMFREADLDPLDIPTPEVMSGLIYEFRTNIFKTRTIKMLYKNTEESSAFKSALTNLVLEELESWDGTCTESIPESSGKLQKVQAGLRICINLDQLSGTLKSYIRFRSKKTIPEEGLVLVNQRTGEKFNCFGSTNGWSTYLRHEEDQGQGRLRGEHLNWEQGEHFEDDMGEWRAILRSSSTRVFLEGLDNLRDWVEVQRIERGREYLIACRSPDVEKVISWGKNSCENFVQIISIGLPEGWNLFRCKNISESCSGIDLLTISNQARLTLLGGVRASGRNSYFEFAKPRIVIENGTGEEIVKVNGKAIGLSETPGQWLLPEDCMVNSQIQIEVFQGNDSIGKKTIYLESFDSLPNFGTTPYRDPSGNLLIECDSCPCAQGSVVINMNMEEYKFDQLPYHISERIIFVGGIPGQIVDWPKESVSNIWRPIWAIARSGRNRWKVYYCSNIIISPSIESFNTLDWDKKSRKKWKEVIYFNRKITEIPKLRVLVNLWQVYQECAKNVK